MSRQILEFYVDLYVHYKLLLVFHLQYLRPAEQMCKCVIKIDFVQTLCLSIFLAYFKH